MPSQSSLTRAANPSPSAASVITRCISRAACGRLSIFTLLGLLSCTTLYTPETSAQSLVKACASSAKRGILKVPDDRSERFLGKVQTDTALCRGGENATRWQDTPWVDWPNYFAAGDSRSLSDSDKKARTRIGEHLYPNGRGVDGALIDLEYQRIELIKFNLFDQTTYQEYITGRDGTDGRVLKQWDAMRLPPTHEHFSDVGGESKQLCQGKLLQYRTLSGICNDAINPLMGSAGTPFARNAQFEATFPDLQLNELNRNRHAGRIDLLTPDPQLISRQLFTREQRADNGCNSGMGSGDPADLSVDCDYLKAPFFNVLAAFWIQFMTHDWFSHTVEGHNERALEPVGCKTPEAEALGCRPGDRREPSLYAETEPAPEFEHAGKVWQSRAPRTTLNQVTAWWDASQLYGHDALSASRVLRDPQDPARLQLIDDYLPLLRECPPDDLDCGTRPHWRGQESTGFPDNWNIGLSFYHNVFAREHNAFVDHVRQLQQSVPEADSGLRHPDQPDARISWQQVDDERLFQLARLVVSAGIAKIHTIEWTTQLLYDEPLHAAMNSNWFGLFNQNEDRVSKTLRRIVNRDENFLSRSAGNLSRTLGQSGKAAASNSLYSVFASGAGIFGLGNSRPDGMLWWKHDDWDISRIEDVNGGINHFGSPFNFPEEFTSVYRLHALVPDLIELRSPEEPDVITQRFPILNTVRAGATEHMHDQGIDSWALSMGRQRLGLLHLRNLPQFLQNLPMPHVGSTTGKLDIPALDIIRDRERGIPRFNEFRRQIGLKTLTGFDDFVDQRLPADSPWRAHQEETVRRLREIYGTHVCDAAKTISVVQRNAQGEFINDCLGHPDGSVVDNIEDVDNIVGWLAEYTRPHGFAISETQFHVFIINASRRLFSDRFFTSSFRPEFYSHAGYDWVQNNGPLQGCPFPLTRDSDGRQRCLEPVKVNGHVQEVSPMKRVLLRTVPQLREELLPVRNVFDPWARDRGDYYSLAWKPRLGAEADPAFHTSEGELP
ncbi:peroxidase family protein [Granulosicoccus sp. 3-233]|uniref:peroxidase family protein n=1 Tax=Granulosicoccus sp. 3-233 TaxID=3417969 RepID=UPI003D33A70A